MFRTPLFLRVECIAETNINYIYHIRLIYQSPISSCSKIKACYIRSMVSVWGLKDTCHFSPLWWLTVRAPWFKLAPFSCCLFVSSFLCDPEIGKWASQQNKKNSWLLNHSLYIVKVDRQTQSHSWRWRVEGGGWGGGGGGGSMKCFLPLSCAWAAVSSHGAWLQPVCWPPCDSCSCIIHEACPRISPLSVCRRHQGFSNADLNVKQSREMLPQGKTCKIF